MSGNVRRVWPMPCGPVRKPETSRPGLKTVSAIWAPWKASKRLPAGSTKEIRSVTHRWSARAAGSHFTATPAASRRPASELRAAALATSQPDLSARLNRAVDEQALFAVVHTEGTHRAGAVHGLHA